MLNLHGKPRGSVTPEQLQELQRPTTDLRPHTSSTAAAGEPSGDPRRRRHTEGNSTQQQQEEQEEDPLMWDGLFSTMIISTGGASRPITFPPEIPSTWGVDIHFRSLPHGAWAGVAMATGSRRAPEYRSTTRGFCRARLQRRPGGAEPQGYMSISTAFVLFPWGKVTRGHPVKWLLHITGAQAQPDPEAARMIPGMSFTLERRPGKPAWELGGLPPKIALQYYYDWGHMQRTGAIYEKLPRSYTLPPSHWEEMGERLIPSPDWERQPPPNPQFDDPAPHDPAASSSTDWGGTRQPHTQDTRHSTAETGQPDSGAGGEAADSQEPHDNYYSEEWAPSPTPTWGPSPGPNPEDDKDDAAGDPDHAHLMQRRMEPVASGAASSHGPRVVSIRGPPRLTGAAAMIRRWLREFAAVLRDHPMGNQIPLLLQQAMEAVGHDQEPEEGDNGTVGGPGPCKKRRMINMVTVARMRLSDISEEDGMDGLNQHQIREDLGTAMFQRITETQWGDQVQQGHHGLAQARKAIATALENTIQGDMDWITPGWGNAMRMVLEDAEELIDEEGLLDLAHPSGVVALHEGAEEAPPLPQGEASVNSWTSFSATLDRSRTSFGGDVSH